MRRYGSVAISKLKPYENNARTHSDEQIDKIANSIKEFDFINPVIVPCLFVEDLNETQKRAYILADNKLSLDASWDDEILRSEIKAEL